MTDIADPMNPRHLPQGMTRNCVDPWVYIEFKTNGDVAPCPVRSGPVGNVNARPLSRILDGDPIRKLRDRLLKGTLDRACTLCGVRAPTTPQALQARVLELLQSVKVPEGFDGLQYLAANPDVAASGADPTSHFLESGRFEGRTTSLKSAPLKDRRGVWGE